MWLWGKGQQQRSTQHVAWATVPLDPPTLPLLWPFKVGCIITLCVGSILSQSVLAGFEPGIVKVASSVLLVCLVQAKMERNRVSQSRGSRSDLDVK
jgi:hypothetical protein